MSQPLSIHYLGVQPYETIWQAMSSFTDQRDSHSPDQLWLVEHLPVYTQGRAGKAEHILKTTDIPIIQTDRGGQVTYHGPGQLILYPLIDLRRQALGVREMVTLLEKLVIDWLAGFGIDAYAKADAPGVYINMAQNDAKIASLGLRIRRGCSFHGIAINIAMDLSPFRHINPCGYRGLSMTQLQEHLQTLPPMAQLQQQLVRAFCQRLGMTQQVKTPIDRTD